MNIKICVIVIVLIMFFMAIGGLYTSNCSDKLDAAGKHHVRQVFNKILFCGTMISFICLIILIIMLGYFDYNSTKYEDYSKVNTHQVIRYFEKDDVAYVEIDDRREYALPNTSPNKDEIPKCIIERNNDFFQNCFVPDSETVIYSNNYFYCESDYGENVLFVDDKTYDYLLNITAIDIPK